MPRGRKIPSEPKPVPCPRCYTPMRDTDEGYACPTHGVPPAEKTKRTRARSGPRQGLKGAR